MQRHRYYNHAAQHTRGINVKNRIEEIRTERGIRQEELARAMGVSRQTISSLENTLKWQI